MSPSATSLSRLSSTSSPSSAPTNPQAPSTNTILTASTAFKSLSRKPASVTSLPDMDVDPHGFHAALARHNAKRVALGVPSVDWQEEERCDLEFRLREGHYLEKLRTSITPLMSGHAGSADHFVAWFESLAEWGPGQQHPLFDWLAEEADLAEMKWFLTQEVAGEAGFEDLVAFTQVKLPAQPKLECARNYWDEMGRGKQGAMHGPLLERMVKGLGLQPSIDTTVWESLALANAMLGMATTRRYAYHSLGALGVIELTAPQRAAKVAQGMRRLEMEPRMRAYFDLHATIDILHSQCWIREIIRPLVTENPQCAQYLAEGALMRLRCGQRCFDRYSHELERDFANAPVAVFSADAAGESLQC